jgi:geranylgeranyl pyrophosphate synthase
VIDESGLRRGKPTVRSAFGNRISVLSGDYLLAQASLKLSRLDNCRLVSIFSYVLADLCDGEVEQLHTSYTMNASWESYYKKTICKTASLFSAGCESAGVLNSLPEERIQALKLYGRNVGIAFQIMDDLLDYTATEAEMGKPVLDDLRNGIMNAPVLLALQSENLTAEEQRGLREQIGSLFEAAAAEKPVEAIIETIQQVLDKARAIEETRKLAEDYVKQACDALDFVAPGTEKSALLALAAYILERRS